MEAVQLSSTFPAIAAEHAAEFRQLVAEAVQLAQAEPGTLQYDWYVSADGTRAVVREIYASSEAALAHVRRGGATAGRLIELGGGLELEVYGTPSPELAELLAPFKPVQYTLAASKQTGAVT